MLSTISTKDTKDTMSTKGNGSSEPNEISAIVFMDLDDTIFQTSRKCGAGFLRPAALDAAGQPSSYFNPQQYNFLKLLDKRSWVIPTTARNLESFRRVQLNLMQNQNQPQSQGAILDYGGLILKPTGERDQNWHEYMCGLTKQATPMLLEIKSLVEGIIKCEGLTCQVRIISEGELNFYVLAKNYNSKLSELALIKSSLIELLGAEDAVWIHSNDNNLAIIPNFLNKSEAVSYFLKTYVEKDYSGLPIIGMGDSLSDFNFMHLCDFMMLPSKSQLAENFAQVGSKE